MVKDVTDTQEEVQIDNKHMKRCLKSLIIRKIRIKNQ